VVVEHKNSIIEYVMLSNTIRDLKKTLKEDKGQSTVEVDKNKWLIILIDLMI